MSLLVCIDGSRYSQSCCAYAAWLASSQGLSIRLLYVNELAHFVSQPFVTEVGEVSPGAFPTLHGELEAFAAARASEILESAANALRSAGFRGRLRSERRDGFLVDCLDEFADETELIVLGKRGVNADFASDHLGSSMERVARAATRPCFVASRSYQKISRVMLAYQAVASCRAALDFIATHAVFEDCEIHLVSVAKQDEGDLRVALDAAAQRLRDAGRAVVCQMLHGSVVSSLSDYAEESGIDLLAIGAYGHSKIRHLILGSTTTELLRDCRLPTLLFR